MKIDKAANKTQKQSYVGAVGVKIGNCRKLKVRVPPRAHEVIDGKMVVIFTNEEHELLAETCRWMVVEEFTRGRPAIDKIRANFDKAVTLKSSVKIGAKDIFYVFIDVDNEEDFNNVHSRTDIQLSNGVSMKILKWTTNFKPNAESTLAQVWINLPDLPWYYYEWYALCRIVSPIGTPLVMDRATTSKTRSTTTKLRVEINLDKPVIHEVQVEVRNQHGKMVTFEQKIEYEELPTYCSHFKVKGHYVEKCN
ncbi:hypothetical protein R3W88_014478 [Solanum pinnatisectum]|uniref:DUF4283 domain-containing protein n=1 Tax=Solanum pinnatisectum TaxID=50273 RepID=A0AAV9KRR1_9SOLN|nr:hypothetical protein R3W88_014478 [Solanum pinnatisectum]